MSTDHRDQLDGSFHSRGRSLGIKTGFAVDLCENKPYGTHEGESLDLSKASDVKELLI